MTEEESKADWLRMYKSVTDPEMKEQARRKAELEKRKEDKKKDTGL